VLRRRGVTLVELVVALTLGGIVLAVATGSLLRQQRAVRWIDGLSGAELQARAALRLLTDELEPLDAAAGDLAAGQASDSSLELRAVVAASLSCDSAATVTLVPETGTSAPLGGVARPPAVGDSAWLYRDSLGWRGHAIIAVSRTTTACGAPTTASGPTYALTLDALASVPAATPVRVTRRERWVVYRASDGRWQLGVRDWSTSTSRFLAPQPVAGPFVRRTPDGRRTGFRYFDATGAGLVPDGTNERAIVRVRIATLALPPSATVGSARSDSADAVLSRRGAY
jgi:prepilin-type N-terminal cleavage/methylation domain-containing protein